MPTRELTQCSRDENFAPDEWNTRQDRIRNDNFREKVGLAPIIENIIESRLRWLEEMYFFGSNVLLYIPLYVSYFVW
jgi:hypothetical protein